MNLSAHTRSSIIALHEAGFSNGEIARDVGVHKNTVARWIQRHEETGDTLHKRGAGRPRCTTPAQDDAVENLISTSPFTSASNVRHQLELPCTSQTIRNRLHDRGIHGHTPANKPELTDLHMEQRVEYALTYADKPATFWLNDVVYCDEKTFSTDEERNVRVWRRKNER